MPRLVVSDAWPVYAAGRPHNPVAMISQSTAAAKAWARERRTPLVRVCASSASRQGVVLPGSGAALERCGRLLLSYIGIHINPDASRKALSERKGGKDVKIMVPPEIDLVSAGRRRTG